MNRALDPEHYRYVPGKTEVVEIDSIDQLELHGFDGEPITEASLKAAAAEAERAQRAGLIPGGKSLSGGHLHSPALRVVVSQETADRVKERAAAGNMSVSRWVRGLIERELA